MSAFTLDIKGQLNSMRLSPNKALWPLFEAVVNSIQAIEDSKNQFCGKITIYAKRESVTQLSCIEKDQQGRIESFVICDNGIGMNNQNYKSFNTAYSTLKIKKGCKGIGRFLWLKAFSNVKIESVFEEDKQYYERIFSFEPNGVTPDDNCKKSDKTEIGTIVTLTNVFQQYKSCIPLDLDIIARKIIDHCLPFFISGNCPQIEINDNEKKICLNTLFDKTIQDTLHQDQFIIKNYEFKIYHIKLPEGALCHEVHFCANMQEVYSAELKKLIPDLQKKIITEEGDEFFYQGYITSKYLDNIVNTTRTDFDFDETGEQISLDGTSKETILETAKEFITAYLSDVLSDIRTKKCKDIDSYVAYNRPQYRYLLNQKPEIYDRIPAGLKPEALDMELHKHVVEWETEIKHKGQLLQEKVDKKIDDGGYVYDDLFKEYWAGVTDISKTCLAEYVTRRKTILSLLKRVLTIKDDGKFINEEAIHSIICPMRHTSDDVEFEEMNLWIVDERLAYHRYLASDKTLKSMPVIESNSTKEPDIAVFDQAFAYSDSEEPFSAITIIEFKKPGNDSKNPIDQVLEYIDLIKSGKKKKADGQSFNVNEGTVFRCYVICDLTDKMRTYSLNGSLLPTVDNIGYSGYNQGRRAYIEVISYNKLVADAQKRNDIFFEKLFSPHFTKVYSNN